MNFLLRKNENTKILFRAFIAFLPIIPFYLLLKNVGAYLAIYTVGHTPDNKYYDGNDYPFAEQIKDTVITFSEIFFPLIIASTSYFLLRKSAKSNNTVYFNNIKEWTLLIFSLVWGVKVSEIGIFYFPWLLGLSKSFACEEVCLVKIWNIPVDVVLILIIITGLFICLKILFLIPKNKRFPLIIGAAIGSLTGDIVYYRLINQFI